jgi:UDP:flavonoid glycosyltransferase YjiC (YdhE family)
MRVLFTIQPLPGHFHPLIPLAQALVEKGHEVAFATGRSFGATVEAVGFRCFPAGLDWLQSPTFMQDVVARVAPEILEKLEKMGGLPGRPARRDYFEANFFGGVTAERIVPDILALYRTWPFDLIVRERYEFGGCVAAELLGIPHATVQVASLYEDYSPEPSGVRLTQVRAFFGLPPDPDHQMVYRYLFLSFVPPSFHHPEITLPPTTHMLRPAFFDTSSNDRIPDWVASLAAQPTIYATMGSSGAAAQTNPVFATILDALRDQPVNLILTVSYHFDPEEFGLQPANVHIERYIPQSLILPYCDLVINHGGFSTVLAALDQGLPMVIIPSYADQPTNARRCVDLDVARMIAPVDLTPQTLRDATMEVLHNPSYDQNAKRLRDEMQALPGLGHAVELLEQLAIEKKPLFPKSWISQQSREEIAHGLRAKH